MRPQRPSVTNIRDPAWLASAIPGWRSHRLVLLRTATALIQAACLLLGSQRWPLRGLSLRGEVLPTVPDRLSTKRSYVRVLFGEPNNPTTNSLPFRLTARQRDLAADQPQARLCPFDLGKWPILRASCVRGRAGLPAFAAFAATLARRQRHLDLDGPILSRLGGYCR